MGIPWDMLKSWGGRTEDFIQFRKVALQLEKEPPSDQANRKTIRRKKLAGGPECTDPIKNRDGDRGGEDRGSPSSRLDKSKDGQPR